MRSFPSPSPSIPEKPTHEAIALVAVALAFAGAALAQYPERLLGSEYERYVVKETGAQVN